MQTISQTDLGLSFIGLLVRSPSSQRLIPDCFLFDNFYKHMFRASKIMLAGFSELQASVMHFHLFMLFISRAKGSDGEFNQ